MNSGSPPSPRPMDPTEVTPVAIIVAHGTVLLLLLTLLSCNQDMAPASAQKDRDNVAENPTQPNILLLVADDLGWADLNCYGSPLIESPNLDQLASHGLQFMRGYAAAPVCSPSRASIQTGLHPARIGITEHIHGYYDNPDWALVPPRIPEGLDLEYVTLAEMAKGAGYQTALVGKWHLGNAPYHPSKQGYDVTYAGGRYGLPSSFYHPFFTGAPFPDLLADSAPGDYLTDVLTDKALRLIEGYGEAPWLINLNFYAPHVPIQGRKDWVRHYTELIDSTHARDFPKPEYAAMVSTIDENVGRLVSALEAAGQLENTMIIFLSDNGGLHVEEVPGFDRHTPPTDNGILRAGKGYVYEGGIRIPFIIHWPAYLERRNASLTPVVTTDIFPTIAAALGNSRAYASQDGQNLLPLLKGVEPPERDLYWHFPHYSPQGGKPAAAIRRGDYKLYLDYEKDSVTHYNLTTGPGENLAPRQTPKEYRPLRQLKTLEEFRRSQRSSDALVSPDLQPPDVGWFDTSSPQPMNGSSDR